MATVQVSTFAAFASAVAVQGDTVEVTADLDVAAEYPNGYTSPLNIKASVINGNGHAVKNIKPTDGDSDALFQFGKNGEWIGSDDPSKHTTINRLHFQNCEPKNFAFWNGNWYKVTFNGCHFEFGGDSMKIIAQANWSYSSIAELLFSGCWFDIEIGASLAYLFNGSSTSASTAVRLTNCVINLTDSGNNGNTFEEPFLNIYEIERCVVMGSLDTACLKNASTDLLQIRSNSPEISKVNSYFNATITNDAAKTITLTMSSVSGSLYPDQQVAINSDRLATGITITDVSGEPSINTDMQMKAGRGLDMPASPTDDEWRVDPAYNGGFPFFVFSVPELQSLWSYNPPTPKMLAGSIPVTKVYIGGVEASAVYLGSEKVL